MPNECSIETFNAPKSTILKADCSKLVLKNVLLAATGSTFLKKIEKIMKQNKNASKNACCSLNFGRRDVLRAGPHSFFAFRSASAERNENHQNLLGGGFGSAGRNAQGRWGEI